MSASKDDYFKKVGRATATTLSSPGYTIGDSTINTGATTNWPVDTGVTFAIDEVGSDGLRISGTYNVFNGVVSGAGQVSQVEYIGGDPNRDYSAGATTRVYILVSAYRDNQFTDGILVHANQNGTLKDTAIPANSIDNSNIKTGAAINGSKLADTSIPTAKYQDGSVTYAKTDGKIWWEEIGRVTLGAPGDTLSLPSLPARKYLKVMVSYFTTGGTTSPVMRFNNDSNGNYANRQQADGAADSTATTQTGYVWSGAQNTSVVLGDFQILNVASVEKVMYGHVTKVITAGAGTTPSRTEDSVKWANTSNQITRIDVINTGTGDFATGSELIVLGRN